ncbi:acyl-CoA/acyl-ACP dehydrogenase [Rhodobacteraceae bacterium NNCM2]|nr:acyl-CoA/acyl-ACP dehydrogenase [Coraliihabitans acroporae]
MAAEQLLSDIRDFAAAEVMPAAPGWSMGQSPKEALFAKAASLGITGLQVPREHGGQGLGFRLKAQVCAALAAVDFGFAMSLVNTHNVAARLATSAPAAIRDRHLPGLLSGAVSACTALTEPAAGSDFAAIQTRSRETGQGWELTGEKRWIVNARHAGLAIVFAKCGDSDDAASIGAFLVDLTQPGVQQYPIDGAFSQTSIGTGGFVLDGAVAECLLLPPGAAFKSILAEINGARTYVAVMCNAMLRAALDQAADYGAARQSFGKPLAAHQAWRAALAEAETDLAAAEALSDRAVTQVDTGEDAQLSAAKAKIHAVRTCQLHLPEMLHAMGAEGLRPDYVVTRHLAAVQMAALTDGATNILRDRVARLSQPRAAQSKD